MGILCAHNALDGTRTNQWIVAARQLTKLLVGVCVVFSLMLMQWQTCPAAAAASSSGAGLIVICTDDGFSVVEVPGTPNGHNTTCNRCPDCQTCSGVSLDAPKRASVLIPTNKAALASLPLHETLHIGLSDHLLPFSGAPPPEKLDQTMLHSHYVPVRFASRKARRMPEMISWH